MHRDNPRGMNPEYDYTFKMQIVGDSGVGKSNLLLRFADDTFTHSYISTIGVDFKTKSLEVHGKVIKCQVWDTVGQERSRMIKSASERGVHCLILAYDSTDQVSFNNAKELLKQISQERHDTVVAVATKCDLTNKKVVDHAAAKEFFEKFNIPLIETSALTGMNVNHVFETAAERVIDRLAPELKVEREKDVLKFKDMQNIINKHLSIYENAGKEIFCRKSGTRKKSGYANISR